MSELSAALARNLAMLSYARRNRKRRSALMKDRTLQALVADLVGARTAAGMTQQQVAARMWTTKGALSRLASHGRTLAHRQELRTDYLDAA